MSGRVISETLRVADARIDVGLDVVAVANHRSGPAMMDGMVFDDAPPQVFDGWSGTGPLTIAGRILAIPHARQYLDRLRPGLLGRYDAVESETHAPPPPADTILNEIGSGAAWQNAGAEAVDLAVEQDVVLVANLGGLDEAFGDLGHGILLQIHGRTVDA